MKFVIVGGDAAGMSAASRAKRRSPDMEVTVLEQTSDVSYSACGMPYNIADPEREIDDLIVRPAQMFREKQGIDLRTRYRVEVIDPARKTVRGTSVEGDPFQVPYDKLLIATGASPIIPHLPGFDLPGVMGLKNLDDGRRIKRFIAEHDVTRAVIMGMGYIALEMCEALRARNIEVVMVKPGPVFLPWMHGDLSLMVREEVKANGIMLHTGHEVKGIEQAVGGLKVLCTDLELEGRMVLVGVGVRPSSELAENAGLALSEIHRRGQIPAHVKPGYLCGRGLRRCVSCRDRSEDLDSSRLAGQQGRLGCSRQYHGRKGGPSRHCRVCSVQSVRSPGGSHRPECGRGEKGGL